eukprot:scaffold473941_cov29-Prasinocladus_malaysianus.AAC.1
MKQDEMLKLSLWNEMRQNASAPRCRFASRCPLPRSYILHELQPVRPWSSLHRSSEGDMGGYSRKLSVILLDGRAQ